MKVLVLSTISLLTLFGGGSCSAWLQECLTIGNESFANTQPSTPADSPIMIRLYTRNFNYSTPVSNGVSVMDQGVDLKKTVLYFLGYHQNFTSASVVAMRDAMLFSGGYANFLLVDWSGFSTKNFESAWMHCKNEVPQQVSEMLLAMSNRGLDVKNNFLGMGFSMGAHCAGFTGRLLKDKTFHIIVGLDPGKLIPDFGICSMGLSPGDADNVHCYYGDRDVYTRGSVCCDFNVLLNNNGHRLQPRCLCQAIIYAQTVKDACSHIYSTRLYADSTNHSSTCQCRICPNYEKYRANECNNTQTAIMGFGAVPTSRGNCYVQTNADAPFCQGAAGTIPPAK